MDTFSDLMYSILSLTAWRMESPQLMGSFHVIASSVTAILACACALYTLKRLSLGHLNAGVKQEAAFAGHSDAAGSNSGTDEGLARILGVSGWIMLVLEVYKQLFIYYVINNGAYDWWYFPFQLCSVPMYMCIVFPYAGAGLRRALTSFIAGFAFLGAAATLVYPQDILRSYIVLTVHGFLWHGILLYISIVCGIAGSAGAARAEFRGALKLFAASCLIAMLINMAAEPVMSQGSLPHQYAAMFYLNPYHISPQPIVSTVQERIGILQGLILYAAVIALAASVIYAVFRVIYHAVSHAHEK